MGRTVYIPESHCNDDWLPDGRDMPSMWLMLHDGGYCLQPAFKECGQPISVKPGEVVAFHVWEALDPVRCVVTHFTIEPETAFHPQANFFWEAGGWEGFNTLEDVAADIRKQDGFVPGDTCLIESRYVSDDFRQKFRLVTCPTGALFHKITEH